MLAKKLGNMLKLNISKRIHSFIHSFPSPFIFSQASKDFIYETKDVAEPSGSKQRKSFTELGDIE